MKKLSNTMDVISIVKGRRKKEWGGQPNPIVCISKNKKGGKR